MPARKPAPTRRTTPAKSVGEKIAEQIVVGQADDSFGLIGEALNARASQIKKRFSWSLDIDGIKVAEDEMTYDMLDLVNRATGETWFSLDGEALLKNHKITRSILEAALICRDGVEASDAIERVGKIRLSAVVKGIKTVEDADPS